MLDYVFFHRGPFERFVEFARAQGLAPVCRHAEDDFEVALPDDLDEDLAERIEAFYEEMMDWNRELHEEGLGAQGDLQQAAGVAVALRDGGAVYAEVDPEVLGRIMGVLTPAEFGKVVDAIVAAVEDPDPRSFCERLREPGGAK